MAEATPCCQTSGVQEHWGGPTLLVWVNACKPLQSRAGRLPATAGNCRGATQLDTVKGITCLKPEDFRFPCLGGRNAPSDFITLFISGGAAGVGPARATGGGTEAAV